jgi:hypothetical protein
MKKNKSTLIIGLSFTIGLYVISAYARNESTQRTTAVHSTSAVRSTPSAQSSGARTYSGGARGVAKAAWNGSSSGSGYRGGGNHYYNFHRGYNHGYHVWGPYRPYWSLGAYFSYLPDDYTTYYVDGSPYYYCDGSYFSPYSNGYMVVPAPDLSNAVTAEPMVQTAPEAIPAEAAAEQSQSTSTGPITINIPNSKGGFTRVKLAKGKDGYIGPQGEFYSGHPTIAELKVLYGD